MAPPMGGQPAGSLSCLSSLRKRCQQITGPLIAVGAILLHATHKVGGRLRSQAAMRMIIVSTIIGHTAACASFTQRPPLSGPDPLHSPAEDAIPSAEVFVQRCLDLLRHLGTFPAPEHGPTRRSPCCGLSDVPARRTRWTIELAAGGALILACRPSFPRRRPVRCSSSDRNLICAGVAA
jgi:hypothetical protein